MPLVLNRNFAGFASSIFNKVKSAKKDIDQRVAPRFAAELEDYTRAIIGNLRTTSSLEMRTGRMIARLLAGVRVTGRGSMETIRVTVDGPPGAVAQEYGATIRAKSARYLAVPVLFGLRADGSPKLTAPRSWQRFKPFVFKSKDGRLFLAYKIASGELRIIYRLIEEIRVRPALGLNRQFDARSGELAAMFGNILIQELKNTDWTKLAEEGEGRVRVPTGRSKPAYRFKSFLFRRF